MIAATRSLDETSLVHGRLGCGTPGWSCSTGMASGSPNRFSRTVVVRRMVWRCSRGERYDGQEAHRSSIRSLSEPSDAASLQTARLVSDPMPRAPQMLAGRAPCAAADDSLAGL